MVKARNAQDQTQELDVRESGDSKGSGVLTLSLLPRGYWSTLFNLELIKSRNKPKAPPAPKEAAPFFLPTVRKEGSVTASFPTPDEYAALKSSLEDSSTGKRASNSASDDQLMRKKSKIKDSETSGKVVEENEEAVMQDLAAMGSAWDDDADEDWGEAIPVKEGGDKTDPKSAPSRSGSRILSKAGAKRGKESGGRRVMPRCKMVAFLTTETSREALPDFGANEALEGPLVANSKLLDYLKTLPPPAVDLELRALCSGPQDEEGIALLGSLFAWFTQRFLTGTDFEVLEAYLHRTLLLHSDTVQVNPHYLSLALSLKPQCGDW